MLDEQEYEYAAHLCRKIFDFRKSGLSREESAAPLLDFYNGLSDFGETEPNAIMHHRFSLYGPLCASCGNPYRTPQVTLCVACGNKRSGDE